MPLHNGAKPGSKGFKENIKAEMAAGKPQKQAVAIAYSVSKDAKGELHVFLPQTAMRNLLGLEGVLRTAKRGTSTIRVDAPAKKPRDMKRARFEELKALLNQFFSEEEEEPEHAEDSTCDADCDCADCSHNH